jgi:hypothetical protein
MCRSDWIDIRIDIMTSLVRIKFSDLVLQEKLLATNNEELVELNWWNDIFWGVCNKCGENNLGKILMKIRKEISEVF